MPAQAIRLMKCLPEIKEQIVANKEAPTRCTPAREKGTRPTAPRVRDNDAGLLRHLEMALDGAQANQRTKPTPINQTRPPDPIGAEKAIPQVPQTIRMVWSDHPAVCLSVCLSACLSVCLSSGHGQQHAEDRRGRGVVQRVFLLRRRAAPASAPPSSSSSGAAPSLRGSSIFARYYIFARFLAYSEKAPKHRIYEAKMKTHDSTL